MAAKPTLGADMSGKLKNIFGGLVMNQRVMLSKKMIKENLIKMLDDNDIYHISVRELCRLSGVNRSTFYAHYSSPRDVLLDIEKDVVAGIIKIAASSRRGDLKDHLCAVCRYLYENKELQKIIMRNNTDDDMARALSDAAVSACVPIGYLGNIDGRDDVDIDFLYTFIDFGMYNVIKKWLMNDIDKTPEQIADLMGNMIFKQL